MIRMSIAVIGFLMCVSYLIYVGSRGGVLAGCIVGVLIALVVFLEIKKELV